MSWQPRSACAGKASGGIRVVLCDDHAMVRSGLRLLLEAEPDVAVVAEAADANEVIDQVRSLQPDVVLLDVVLNGRSGIDAVGDVRAVAPDTKILMLSMQNDPTYVRAAFAAGADGYVPKEAAGAELVEALKEVAAGRSFVDPSLGARLAVAVARVDESGEVLLSDREREILRLLALGYTNLEVADLLSISVRTVETHRAHILQKLGLATRADIVRYALATGELRAPAAAG